MAFIPVPTANPATISTTKFWVPNKFGLLPETVTVDKWIPGDDMQFNKLSVEVLAIQGS